MRRTARTALTASRMLVRAILAVGCLMLLLCSPSHAFSPTALPGTLPRSGSRCLTALRCSTEPSPPPSNALARRAFLLSSALAAAAPAHAADLFGTGQQVGWGDKVNAGVKWDGGFANPLTQQPNDFIAEVVNRNQIPVIITFVKPKKWKLSTNTGITVQDYIASEGGFVLVAPMPEGAASIADVQPRYIYDKVFDIRGRYGAFGKIDDVSTTKAKVEQEPSGTVKYIDFKFTSLSPGGRDIDRVGCIKCAEVDGDVIMFVASSNANRWKNVKSVIADTLLSFSAAQAPKTRFKNTLDSGIGNFEALGKSGYDLLRYDSDVWTK